METKQIRSQENQFANFIKKAIEVSIADKPISFFKKFIITQSSEEEDTKYSFDMIFSGNLQISVRLRKFSYLKYKDVSIRSRSRCGYKTEIDKLSEGKGHIYFYGWLDPNETRILKWLVYDINAIRDKLYNNGVETDNGDGTKGKYYLLEFLKENSAILNYGYTKVIYNNNKKSLGMNCACKGKRLDSSYSTWLTIDKNYFI